MVCRSKIPSFLEIVIRIWSQNDPIFEIELESESKVLPHYKETQIF